MNLNLNHQLQQTWNMKHNTTQHNAKQWLGKCRIHLLLFLGGGGAWG